MNQILGFILSKKEKYGFLALAGAYLLTRLYNLTILPIFTDEAIYIRWSEIAWSVRTFSEARNYIFIPLTDGKQPLFMWLAGIPMQFMSDHVAAGRLPSVFSGLASVFGIWLVSFELFRNKKIAWLSSIIYLIVPYTLLYDRLALADSMLAMFGIWSMYLGLLLLRTLNLKVALLLGLIYGLGLLTKSPALFYWALSPAMLLFFHNKKKTHTRFIFLITSFGPGVQKLNEDL
jgi:4-amino-4-deoxy-L-arabinose transferase-like glycosyltransferase